MKETIRDIINKKSEILKEIDSLGLHKAAQELVEISALLASINKEVVDRNYWYNILCQVKLKETSVAAKAKIIAQASPEWQAWQAAIGYQKAALDLIRALKYYLRQSEQEFRETKY